MHTVFLFNTAYIGSVMSPLRPPARARRSASLGRLGAPLGRGPCRVPVVGRGSSARSDQCGSLIRSVYLLGSRFTPHRSAGCRASGTPSA